MSNAAEHSRAVREDDSDDEAHDIEQIVSKSSAVVSRTDTLPSASSKAVVEEDSDSDDEKKDVSSKLGSSSALLNSGSFRVTSTKEESRITITPQLMSQVVKGLKTKLVRIGSRAEQNFTTSISLRSSDLNDDHAKELSATVTTTLRCPLRYLDLSDVMLTSVGYRAIKFAVAMSQIEHLALRHNRINDDDARMLLLDELQKPPTFTFMDSPLQSLDLRFNNITDVAAKVIVDALNNKVKKHHLRNLNLAENHISSIGAELFAKSKQETGHDVEVVVTPAPQTSEESNRTCLRRCQAGSCRMS
jgi:Leucine-rich repeat (LRR) protein